jgi:hypothetical protein
MEKLGVIVPFRHRWEHLNVFMREITNSLNKAKIPHEIIIVNQDNGKQFNRGMLLNIGFRYAKVLRCDYVVFHDVDLVPVVADYTYCSQPMHLATQTEDEVTGERNPRPFEQYFGGVTIFSMEDFEKINGYSNKYWGWGFEDDDLLLRCEKKNIGIVPHYIKNTKNHHKALKFNGKDSFIRAKNNIDITKNVTIFASFFPDDLIYDPTKDIDVYTVFSLPGYDTAISYNSFRRYNFVTFDEEDASFYINTDITTNYQTNVCVTLDHEKKEAKLYQDGNYIGKTSWENALKNYKKQKYFFIGAGNPKREGDPNFFKGYIDSFAIIERKLNEEEILKLSKSNDLTEYLESKSVKVYYDAKHIENYKLVDLSGNGNDASIFKCEIEELDIKWFKRISVPLRRESLFRSLKHEQNGFFENKWKDKATRWNQLRFHNEVSNHASLISKDGLSDLRFTEHGKETEGNITQVNVGL